MSCVGTRLWSRADCDSGTKGVIVEDITTQLLLWPDCMSEPKAAIIRPKRTQARLQPHSRESARSVSLVLASGSPAKVEVLKLLGLRFIVDPADLDERAVTARSPEELVHELALSKAIAVGERHSAALVLGADTLVVDDSDVIGKPRDASHAKRFSSDCRVERIAW